MLLQPASELHAHAAHAVWVRAEGAVEHDRVARVHLNVDDRREVPRHAECTPLDGGHVAHPSGSVVVARRGGLQRCPHLGSQEARAVGTVFQVACDERRNARHGVQVAVETHRPLDRVGASHPAPRLAYDDLCVDLIRRVRHEEEQMRRLLLKREAVARVAHPLLSGDIEVKRLGV